MALMYAAGLVALVVIWIKLLFGKREAEKSVLILMGCVGACAAVVLTVSLFKKPLPVVTVTEYAVITLLFAVFTVTEWLFYRKTRKNGDDGEN